MDIIKTQESLRPFNTFGMNVQARYFARFDTIFRLQDILARHVSQDIFVLGGGSNILFTKDYDGIILKNETKGIEIVEETEDAVYLKAAGGEVWHQFVLFCIANGYAGVENLSFIPGSVGAAPIQNIGAYGVEIKDIFHSLEAYSIKDGHIRTFLQKECEFGYRESIFKKSLKNQYIILAVTFKLNKHPKFHTSYGAIQEELDKMNVTTLSIKAISDAVIAIRSSKLPDPKQIGNAGSFFKNPTIPTSVYEEIKTHHPDIKAFPVPNQPDQTKIAAGWLIEQAGWKGYREGDAGVHPKQALVLVNYGNATGKHIFDLSEKIIADIQQKYNITLEREVNIL